MIVVVETWIGGSHFKREFADIPDIWSGLTNPSLKMRRGNLEQFHEVRRWQIDVCYRRVRDQSKFLEEICVFVLRSTRAVTSKGKTANCHCGQAIYIMYKNVQKIN